MSQRSAVVAHPAAPTPQATVVITPDPASTVPGAPVDLLAGITPEEMAAALALIRAQQAAAAAAAAEAARRAETGYPKVLYNPIFLREQIRQEFGKPNKEGRRQANVYQFVGGSLTVDDAAQETFVRQACPGRIFEPDTDQLIRCKTCGFAARSTAAMFAHQNNRGHQ